MYPVPVRHRFFFGEKMNVAELFPDPPHRVLVACSGGMDSVYLLLSLWGCREELDLELTVVSCDHGLRAESRADAEWVRHLAWSLALPCHVVRFDREDSRKSGESMEMWARRMRREAFRGIATRIGADTVALGHHLDDQAETVMMRLCRGTGTGGAAGIARVREEGGVRFVRPLLGMRREAIRSQLQSWGRIWREDKSNGEDIAVRNRLRNRILPEMCREVNAKSVEHLAAFAEELRGLESWAVAETEKALSGCWAEGILDLTAWRAAHPVLRERMVLSVLERWGADPLKRSRNGVLDLVRAWGGAQHGSKFYEVAGIRLIRTAEQVSLEEVAGESERLCLPLPCGECVRWPPLGRMLGCEPAETVSRDAIRTGDWRGPLTAFCREGDLSVRCPRVGDRYQPAGLKGTAKLSDLLGGAKVPLPLRKGWPVVVAGEEIVWVPGFRVAESWKAGPGMTLRLFLKE